MAVAVLNRSDWLRLHDALISFPLPPSPPPRLKKKKKKNQFKSRGGGGSGDVRIALRGARA